MALTSETMSPADIAAVTGNRNNGGLFGDGNGAWFLIILFLFAFMGGWGGNWGGNGGGTAQNYTLASDFATIQRQLSDGFGAMERKGDSINNGLCDGFYAQNTTMLNGFAGVNQNMNTQGYETRNAIQNAQISAMQNANAIQTAIADCCCKTQQNIKDVGTQTVFNTNAIQRDIANQGFAAQAAHCETVTAINGAKNDIIKFISDRDAQNLRDENQALRLAASQTAQNAYLINQLRPCPIPAYAVANPYCCNQQTFGGCA